MANNTDKFTNITLRDGRTVEAVTGSHGYMSTRIADRPGVPAGLIMAGCPDRTDREALNSYLADLGIDESKDWENGAYHFTPGVNCTEAPIAFKVGEGVSWNGWSDRYPGHVVNVSKSGARVSVQRAKATLLNGYNSGEADALTFEPGGFAGHTSGTQRYEFEADPKGEIVTFSRRKNGRFYQVGTPPNGNGVRLSAGISKHHDYNF